MSNKKLLSNTSKKIKDVHKAIDESEINYYEDKQKLRKKKPSNIK